MYLRRLLFVELNKSDNVFVTLNTLFKGIGSFIDWLQRARFLLPIIIVIIIFLVTFLCFRRKCMKITNERIQEYSAIGKYIGGLFVELNDSKEHIRAFCFNSLWKQRVIRSYNTLFNDKLGRELLHVYTDKSVRLKLLPITSISRLQKEIRKTKSFLKKIECRELVCNPDYKNTNMKYECFGGSYTRTIERIDRMSSFLAADYMIVTGTAGNGKSMMLCSIAEQLVKHKEAVLLLNARDIKEDLLSYLANQLGLPNQLEPKKELIFLLVLRLQAFLRVITRKNIYIIIDAVNENDSNSFLDSFAKQVEKVLGFHHVKVIVSCRSEYYDLEYKKYLVANSIKTDICYLDLQENEYTYEARERLISNYARHYGFTGEIAEGVKEKLTKQLLLVRIFFEIYAHKSENIYELNKYELYQTYIDNTDNTDLKDLISQLAKYMFANKQYENIPVNKISSASGKHNLIDSSILICRTIIKDKGTILEKSEEVLNFVYDEMRDYLITRELLNANRYKDRSINYIKVKKYLKQKTVQGAQCFEGVVNYLFNHCCSENNTQMLDYLLFNIIKPRDDQIDGFRNRRNRQLTSWGLSLLFETDYINTDLGDKYVDYILQVNPGNEGQKLMFYLLIQENSNGKHTLNILLDSFLRSDKIETFESKLRNTLASWKGEGVTVHDFANIYAKIKDKNPLGAERFAIYASVIAKYCKWENKPQTDFNFLNESKEAIGIYLNKLKERFN